MNILLVSILVCSFWLGHASSNQSACGDWEPYKDEHCYKIFDTSKLEPYEAAEKVCQQNAGHLVTIHYAEEQEFLTNFIFKKNKVVDNVWIGAKFDVTKYKWRDGFDLVYSNWAKNYPTNHSDNCVQMQSEVEFAGKWINEPCAKRNVVVCQKRQQWSPELLEAAVFEMKHTLQQVQTKLSQVEDKLHTSEQNFTKSLSQIKQGSILPIGFIYVQLPKEKAPKDIWPSVTWTEVSSEYSGVFFRVAGGTSAPFGQIQEANSTDISNVFLNEGSYDKVAGSNTEIKSGQWTPKLFSGSFTDSNNYAWSFLKLQVKIDRAIWR